MELPLDILRLILLFSKVNAIRIITSVDKNLYSLCSEKNLWLEKFKEKNLVIINDKIVTVGEYLNEYSKVSYASYTALNLVDMIINNKNNDIENHRCWLNAFFSIDDLKNILIEDHPIFKHLEENDHSKKYIYINIIVGEVGTVSFNYCEIVNNQSGEIKIKQDYNGKRLIISLIYKVLYYHSLIGNININNLPEISIVDADDISIIIPKDFNIVYHYHPYYKKRMDNRKQYWDECYSKYEELYF